MSYLGNPFFDSNPSPYSIPALAPTPPAGDNSKSVATTEFVAGSLLAPTLTGAVTVVNNNIGSNFVTAFTSGLKLSNPAPSNVGLTQDAPAIEFDGSYWNGTASVPATVALVVHHSNPLNIARVDLVNTAPFKNGVTPIGLLFAITNSAPATALVNNGGTEISLQDNVWNGAASIADLWNLTTQTGAGANPTTSLLLQHVGSTGAATLDLTNSTGTNPLTVLLPTSTFSGPFTPLKTTVALLPAGAEGAHAYATNGRKVGEGAGLGTGVPVYWSSGSWRVFSTDAAVAS